MDRDEPCYATTESLQQRGHIKGLGLLTISEVSPLKMEVLYGFPKQDFSHYEKYAYMIVINILYLYIIYSTIGLPIPIIES